ncbi:MAG: hypothetical protein IH946_12820, partial [Bacteroidetes bacterium]|nr:hypothetical protein [Bacteroidota bacterium]
VAFDSAFKLIQSEPGLEIPVVAKDDSDDKGYEVGQEIEFEVTSNKVKDKPKNQTGLLFE